MTQKRIIQLPDEVVNKIAAGEVIVYPMNAVKELVENSLDAGSTEISVSIKNGGLDQIQIQDNGCGIDREDLPKVCQRFATSKLSTIDDLKQMHTFGFRGEALASISYVANVTIVTRTANDKCAYRATFHENNMIGQIQSSAGLIGTTINVENLFFNCQQRRSAFKYPKEQAQKIADIIVKYAVEYPSVSFAFRRIDGVRNSNDFRSPGKGDQHETIRALMSAKSSQNLINFTCEDDYLKFSAKGCMSAPVAAYSSTSLKANQDKHKSFFFFINGRCVELPRLKQTIEMVMSSKDLHSPFMIISLKIDPARVDVNVHPTKSIVHFLEEDAVMECIEQELMKRLSNIPSCGVVDLDSSLTPFSPKSTELIQRQIYPITVSKDLPDKIRQGRNDYLSSNPNYSNALQQPVRPDKIVRTDASARKIDEFFNTSLNVSQVELVPIEDGIHVLGRSNMDQATNSCLMKRKFDFNSVHQLKKEICTQVDKGLQALFRKHCFVGFYDLEFALFQVETRCYIFRIANILRELFYQLIIFSFGNIGTYKLLSNFDESCGNEFPGIPIAELLNLHLSSITMDVTTIGEYTSEAVEILFDKRGLLWDYFGIRIKNHPEYGRCLISIPCLIENYVSMPESLPKFIYDLSQVNYDEEMLCFQGVARAISELLLPNLPFVGHLSDQETSQLKSTLASRVFPLLKTNFLPPKNLNQSVDVVMSMEDAFRKFKRC